MNTKPGSTPQATALFHGASTRNSGMNAIVLLDAVVRQHKTTRRTVQAWFEARLTRRR